MYNNIERKRHKFWEMQQFLKRKFKGAKTMAGPNGTYFVGDKEGRNIIGEKYPDLSLSDNVFDAWKNAFVIEHWNRQEARSIKGIKADIKNNTIQGGESLSKAIYEYFEDNSEIYDEENL